MFFGEISSSENENGIKVEVITFFLYLFPHKKILRLKHIICIWIGICFLCASLQKAGATAVPQSYAGQRAYADSIMDKVIFFAPFYERVVDEYKAELYIKGWANIRKKNHLLRFIPSMFRMKKGVREYMMETYSFGNWTAVCLNTSTSISTLPPCCMISCSPRWLPMQRNSIPII